MEEYDTLVLSGGGIKGYILIGALQALIDMNKLTKITTFIGTSIGCIINYLLCIGYTPIEIMVQINLFKKQMEKIGDIDINNLLNGNGGLNYSILSDLLERLTINKIGSLLTLQKLKERFGKTLICVTYNTTQCITEYIGPDNYPDLPCLIALRMSSNIPIIFERFKYMDNYFIDGGITDNFPIQKALEISKNAIGICLNINEKSLKDMPEDGLVSYFFRLLQTPIIQSTRNKIDSYKNSCKIISIHSDLKNFITFDLQSKIKLDMFSLGYEETKKCF